MIKEYIKGSILDAPQKYIMHGVNAQNTMGSGVAKVLFNKWPEVKSDYHELCKISYPLLVNGPEDLLGTLQFVEDLEDSKSIINAFTQEYFGYDGQLYLSYSAIKDVFKELNDIGMTEVAIPKIGCGLAGGHWEAVEQIINLCTPNLDVYVYYLED